MQRGLPGPIRRPGNRGQNSCAHVLCCGSCVAVKQSDGNLALEAVRLEAREVAGERPKFCVWLPEGVSWIGENDRCGALLTGDAEMCAEAVEVTDHAPLELSGEVVVAVRGWLAEWLWLGGLGWPLRWLGIGLGLGARL